jgi:hypothetical protein
MNIIYTTQWLLCAGFNIKKNMLINNIMHIHKTGRSYHSEDILQQEERILKLLADIRINTDKVRIAFTPLFKYDVTDDVVNPDTVLVMPSESDGKFMTGEKPVNISPNAGNQIEMRSVTTYENISFVDVNTKANNSPNGIVIYADIMQPNILIDLNKQMFNQIRFIEI